MQDVRFEFGRNWQSFVRQCVDQEAVAIAVASLRRMLDGGNLEGRTFLDIGSGSGLFSLAACLLGATSVVAFDMDALATQAATALRIQSAVPPERWTIHTGSVLDDTFLATIEPADVVYAWGVLHHTGALWRAIDNAVSKVRPGGVLALSIYNSVDRRIGSSAQWAGIKRAYNRAPVPLRRVMEYGYVCRLLLGHLVHLRNPVAQMRNHRTQRGMDFRHDVRDWLGGYPFEYAAPDAVRDYLQRTFGLQSRYVHLTTGHGCNEFTFARPSGE